LRTHLAADYAGIAKCLELNHDLLQAVEMQSKATAILDQVVKANPENATLSEYLGEGLNRLATYRKEQGDLGAALETYRKAHQIFRDLLLADGKDSLAKTNFGFSSNGVAESMVALGKAAAAAKVFQESIVAFEEMSPRSDSNRYPRTGLANAYSGLGDAESVLAAGKNISPEQRRQYWEEARSSCQKSLALWIDKEQRGELESGEHEARSRVAECVAASERHVAALKLGRGVPN
jgi:tetratricopeptide (TPR) repeat protein